MDKPDLLCHTWTNAPSTIPQLYLSGWHQRDTTERCHVKPSFHPRWVLDYALTNCGRVRVGDETTPWQHRLSGVAHLYPPHTPYWEDTRGITENMVHGYVVFTGGDVIGLDKLLPLGQSYIRIEDPQKMIAGPLEAIARSGHYSGARGYWRALSSFFRLVDLLQSAHYNEKETYILRSTPEEAMLLSDHVRQYMQLHLIEPLTIQQLAEEFHVSPSTLSHKFRKETGLSPIQALIELRLDKAQALLQGGFKLEDIASQTGFCNAFYLSKMFKQHRGKSPRLRNR